MVSKKAVMLAAGAGIVTAAVGLTVTYASSAQLKGGLKVTVLTPAGVTSPGSTVLVLNPNTGEVVAQGVANASGVYDTGLAIIAGTYEVQAQDPNYAGSYVLAAVTPGTDTPVTVTLKSGPPAPTQYLLFSSFQVNPQAAVEFWQANGNLTGLITAIAWIVLKNASGQTVALGSSAPVLVPPGVTGDFLIHFSNLVPSGKYTAEMFCVDQNNQPISLSVSRPVTVTG